MINYVKINEGDKSLSIGLNIDDIPTTQFFNRQLLSQVHKDYGDSIVSWLQRRHEHGKVEVTFQPNDADYVELADHLDTSYLKYTLPQARTICEWIYDNIRQLNDDIDWAAVFLEILEGANAE